MNSADDIFLAALDLPPEGRADYLRRACDGDAVLRARVEGMLARAAVADDFFEKPVAPGTTEGVQGILRQVLSPMGEGEGDRIGRYKLLQKIGTGGMGVVYMAEQEIPVRRRVALKIIKLGMDTRQVVARFEAERQALALMDHPNIARVLDAGATESGRPFFVMELVMGIPITEFCDRNHLGVRERLELFLPVCRAIQSAHQKGVIHRDIKPSNVMVTLHHGEPMAKVIDFGVAKATSQRLTDKTVFTQYGNMIGTPAYMSPEQAEMSSMDVDTRTDVYSLGVLLYELLTGTTPFPAERLRGLGIGQIQKVIAEEEPPTPSTRVSTLAGSRRRTLGEGGQPSFRHLPGEIRGDLDWIVMKCLEKDRRRRYETPNELAADLERHLEDEPVSARPPTAAYRLHKAFRRNRAGFVGGIAVLMALFLGILFTSTQAIRARRAEALAMERRDDAEAIARFLTDVFRSPDPKRSGYSFTVAEALRTAAERLDKDLSRMPERRAALQSTLANTYGAIGLHREAAALWQRVLEHRRERLGPEDPETLKTATALVQSLLDANRPKEALAIQEQTVEIRRRRAGPEARETLSALDLLASVLERSERPNDAVQIVEQLLETLRRTRGPEHPDTVGIMGNLAVAYDSAGRRDDALNLQIQTLALRRKISGAEHPSTLYVMANLASSLCDAGRLEEAIAMQDDLVRLRRKVLGPEHPDTLMAMHYRAYYEQLRDAHTAIPLHREVLALRRKTLGPGSGDTILSLHYLAGALESAGRREEAISVREEVVRLRESANGPAHPHTLDATLVLMDDFMQSGRTTDGLVLLHRCADRVTADSSRLLEVATREAWFAPDQEYRSLTRRILDQVSGLRDAIEMERAGRTLCLRPPDDPATAEMALLLARRVWAAGTNGAPAPNARFVLGVAEMRHGHPAAAEPLFRSIVSEGSPEDALVNASAHYHAMTLAALGRHEEARRVFEAAAEAMSPLPADPTNPLDGKYRTQQLLPWMAHQEARAALGASGVAR
ncbi:MAG: serine/threonine-protein kinase [Verrucomicrobiota bacterium]